MEQYTTGLFIAIIFMLAWGLKLIRQDRQQLEIDNLEKGKTIDKITQENLKLMDKIFELNKKIRTNGVK